MTYLHERLALFGASQGDERVAAVVGASLRGPRNHVRTSHHVILRGNQQSDMIENSTAVGTFHHKTIEKGREDILYFDFFVVVVVIAPHLSP